MVLLAYNFGAKFQRIIQVLMLVPGSCHFFCLLSCIFLRLWPGFELLSPDITQDQVNFSDNCWLVKNYLKWVVHCLFIDRSSALLRGKKVQGSKLERWQAQEFKHLIQRKIQILMLVPGACHLSCSLPCIFLPLNDAELRSVKRQWPTPLRWFLIGQRSNRSTSYDSRKSIWPRVQSKPSILLPYFDLFKFFFSITPPICKETMTTNFVANWSFF